MARSLLYSSTPKILREAHLMHQRLQLISKLSQNFVTLCNTKEGHPTYQVQECHVDIETVTRIMYKNIF